MVIEETALELILAAGDARAKAFAALKFAKTGNFEKAALYLKEAEEHLARAHGFHRGLLEDEAQGGLDHPTLLLIHAHAQVMSAISEKTLIEELIEIYKRIK